MRGHIHKRVHTRKDGKVTTAWYVVVDNGRDTAGHRRQKWHGGFRTRKEAEAAQAKLVSEINGGIYVAPNGLTLTEWAVGHWLPTMRTQVKPTTWHGYDRNLRLHVLPKLGHLTLVQVTPAVLNRLYAELAESGRSDHRGGLNPKTIRSIHNIVHKALDDAVDAGLIAANAVGRAKPPKLRVALGREMRVWDPRQLREFLDFVSKHGLRPAFHLAAMTGMRRGEVLGLRWSDIDFGAKRLAVRQTIVAVKYELQISTPKSHQARVIDLDDDTLNELRAHQARQADDKQEWAGDYADSGLVFAKENGDAIHPHSFSQFFERAVARSGLPVIRLHDLRHTHATILLKANAPIKVVSERLGHEDPAFTLKQYAHVLPGMQAEAAAAAASLVRLSNR